MPATLLFKFVFLSNANPAVVLTNTELTGAAAPTVNISSVALADGTTIASVVSGGALVYDSYTKSWSYRLAGADLATYAYTAMATTTYATASPASVHALGMVVPDELVSSRNATTPPTVGAVADAVWDEALAGHTAAGSAGAALGVSGASSKIYTATVDGLAAAGVYCRMTTDISGSVNVASGTSDASGHVTFWHDLAVGTTVYIWRYRAGVAFTDPDTETI